MVWRAANQSTGPVESVLFRLARLSPSLFPSTKMGVGESKLDKHLEEEEFPQTERYYGFHNVCESQQTQFTSNLPYSSPSRLSYGDLLLSY